MAMESEIIIQGWFRVDVKPLKQALNVVVKKWTYSLSKHLSDDVMGALEELHNLVLSSKKGLQTKIQV